MRKRLNIITAIFLVALLALPLASRASSLNIEELDNATGSISLTLQSKSGGKARNVEISLYQVGEYYIENNNLLFKLPEPLQEAAGEDEISLNSLTAAQNKESASKLWSIIYKAEQNGTSSETGQSSESLVPVWKNRTDNDGTAPFKDLPVGAYLAVQTSRNSSYHDMTSFLMFLPMTSVDGSNWEFEIEAAPKVKARSSGGGGGTNTDPEKPETSDNPKDPEEINIDDPDVPTSHREGTPNHSDIELSDDGIPLAGISEEENSNQTDKLPQTGMLQWPIPIMAMAGMAMFGVGWRSEQKRRKDRGK